MRGTALFLKEVDCDHEMKMHTIFCIGSIVYIKTRRFLLKASGRYSLSHRIRERIPNNLGRILHHYVVTDARCRPAYLSRNSRIAVILVVKLVHQNQLFRRNSCSHAFAYDMPAGGFHVVVRKCCLPFSSLPMWDKNLNATTFPFLVFSVIIDILNVPFQATFKCLFTHEPENVYPEAKGF